MSHGGGGDKKSVKKSVTYYLNGPLGVAGPPVKNPFVYLLKTA
jgi:hypothetical protein